MFVENENHFSIRSFRSRGEERVAEQVGYRVNRPHSLIEDKKLELE